jgi:hypothetical protein
MMRLGRRASLLVAFYLLTSAATASAECAWVVWSDTLVTSPSALAQTHDVAPLGGFKSQAECDSLASRLMATKGGETRTTHPSLGPTSRQVSFVCLPDTVDPRGPKGK